MTKTSKRLKIFISGVPPGVKVDVFDAREEKGSLLRALLLEVVAGPEHSIETEIYKGFEGIPVRVVIRAAGFLPYQYRDTIKDGIGLFHAANLKIDRLYSGSRSKVPDGWNHSLEYRIAERKVQRLYRRFRK